MWWLKIFSWLSGLNIGDLVSKGVDAYSKAKDTQVALDQHETDLIKRAAELEVQNLALQQQLKVAEIGHPFEVEKLFAYVTLIYYGKILLWDKAFADLTHAATDPLTGWALIAANLVIGFYFGKSTILGAAAILKSRK